MPRPSGRGAYSPLGSAPSPRHGPTRPALESVAMNALLIRMALLLSIVVALTTIACGDDGAGSGSLSEQEYFERVATMVSDTEEKVFSAREHPYAPGLSGDETDARILHNDSIRANAYRDLAVALSALIPPKEHHRLHGDLIDAVDDYADKLLSFVIIAEKSEFDERTEPSDPDFVAYADAFRQSDTASARFAHMCSRFVVAAESSGHPQQLWCAQEPPAVERVIRIAPDIRGRIAPVPSLPEGLTAASQYIEFEIEGDNGPAIIGFPLNEQEADASSLAWYFYVGGEWSRLDVPVTLEENGLVAEGDFDSVPASLVVLREE